MKHVTAGFFGKMLQIAVLVAGFYGMPVQAAEPLPSWNDGPARTAILEFVDAATNRASPNYIKTKDRIAVFDNDGTLWAEQPYYFQALFALDRAKAMAAADPAFAATPTLKAAAAGDFKAVMAGGEDAILEVVKATHSGLTIDAFQVQVADWLKTARHPVTGLPYTDMVYQPMIELLDHLRANGFETYIVSGGGLDFMRVFAEDAYGIPPQNVIGSMGKARFEIVDGIPEIFKDPGIDFIDDGKAKPLGIARHIGKRPVFVAGNSDGDLAMAQWATIGQGARFTLIVHHTDAKREWAYDRDGSVGRLDKALDAAKINRWTVVDMASDWATIYPTRAQ